MSITDSITIGHENDCNRVIAHYLNGSSYYVTLYKDGTKCRYHLNNDDIIMKPETIDVKITNYCDLGCSYCHESSTVRGKHGDLDALISVLEPLGSGVELAIGGGNPLDHPALESFLERVVAMGMFPNLTINQGHIQRAYSSFRNGDYEEMRKLAFCVRKCNAVGISITDESNIESIRKFKDDFPEVQVVIHVINGIHSKEVLDDLHEKGLNHVLILGYKNYGFGKKYLIGNEDPITKKMKDLKIYLPVYMRKMIISFDNLAIEQLDPMRFFSKDFNKERYMGDDFTFSMYIDAVLQEFAPTSRSGKDTRKKWKDCDNILQYFQENRGSKI